MKTKLYGTNNDKLSVEIASTDFRTSFTFTTASWGVNLTIEDARQLVKDLQQAIKDMDKLEDFTTQDKVEKTAKVLQDLPKRTVDPVIQGLLDRVQELEKEVADLQSNSRENEITAISDEVMFEHDPSHGSYPVIIHTDDNSYVLTFGEAELLRNKLDGVLEVLDDQTVIGQL